MSKLHKKSVKCEETTEAWISLTDFAASLKVSKGFASRILKQGVYKQLHYKYI